MAKMNRLFAIALLGTPLPLFAQTVSPPPASPATAQGDVAVTIYNNDRALVQDVRQISFGAGRHATPEWSPRGDLIAFTRIAGDFRVGVMSPDGSGERMLTDSWQDEAPTWAPNGRVIQFFRTEKNSGKTGIWQVDLTGRNERKLPTPVDGSDPAWGPVLP